MVSPSSQTLHATHAPNSPPEQPQRSQRKSPRSAQASKKNSPSPRCVPSAWRRARTKGRRAGPCVAPGVTFNVVACLWRRGQFPRRKPNNDATPAVTDVGSIVQQVSTSSFIMSGAIGLNKEGVE